MGKAIFKKSYILLNIQRQEIIIRCKELKVFVRKLSNDMFFTKIEILDACPQSER